MPRSSASSITWSVMRIEGPAPSARHANARLEIDGLELPAVEKISNSQEEDPFQVLIATLLSARTQDATTLGGVDAAVRAARTPRTMAQPHRQAD